MLRLLFTTKIWRRGEFISEEQRAMRFEDAVKIYIYRKTTGQSLNGKKYLFSSFL